MNCSAATRSGEPGAQWFCETHRAEALGTSEFITFRNHRAQVVKEFVIALGRYDKADFGYDRPRRAAGKTRKGAAK